MNKKINEWRKWPIKTIEKSDEFFPKNLSKISTCPAKLYYRGNWNVKLFEKTLAIVGSRRMTKYGQMVIENFMPEILSKKTTVISGFMYGIDTAAHCECLKLGGKTIAVLGGGLDWLVPTENDQLYLDILENDGLVISEYDKNFKPTLWSFPQRNRIVSALSTEGVLIVEAGLKSGSLITAKLALKQKKKIFATPGMIYSRTSEGTNWLIKSGGAKMITEVGEIFGEKLPEQQGMFRDYSDLSEIEKNIISILENEEVTLDELCLKIKEPISTLATTISMMLMRDLVSQDNGKIYLN